MQEISQLHDTRATTGTSDDVCTVHGWDKDVVNDDDDVDTDPDNTVFLVCEPCHINQFQCVSS